MRFRQRQIRGWIILGLAAILGAAWLLRLDYARKVTTDVLELIPADQRQPELAIVRQLASQAEARTMLFALTMPDGKSAPVEAARRFAAELVRDSVFTVATAQADAAPQETIGSALFSQRFELLFPRWLAARGDSGAEELARAAAGELHEFLARPEALAWQDLVTKDPLLLLPAATRNLEFGALPEAKATGLVWAQIAVSPLLEAGQAPVFDVIDRATERMQARHPGLKVEYSGINRFAAASRTRIKAEVFWLNTLSLVGVLTVAFLFIRTVHRGLHFLPVMGFSILGAWVCTTALFDRLHVIVFVVGSLLTGAAIDYGFYVFMQPPAHPNEDYEQKVRRLLRPLLASCFTTVAGFGLLISSDLPMIRHLGVFVSAGLVSALAAAIVYFATIRDPYLPTRRMAGVDSFSTGAKKWLQGVLVVGWILAIPGVAQLRWKDDIRDLEIPSPELKSIDQELRRQFGQRRDAAVYLSHGETIDEARKALAKFEAWLAGASGGRARFVNLGIAIPTEEEFAAAVRFLHAHPDFAKQVVRALGDAGFEPEAFAAFQEEFEAFASGASGGSLSPAIDQLLASLAGPTSLLAQRGQSVSWIATLVQDAPSAPMPADLQTVEVRQLESLNRLFAQYRESALRLSLAGLGIVGAGVFAMYGWRNGARIFAIPCGACLLVFGVLGWFGLPLNLFHLLGAFLGVCLTHNYSIFTAASAFSGAPTPVSVRLSALTTAASFGALAMSSIPVVHALGVTVLSIVLTALCMIESEHLAPLGKSHE